MVKPPQLGAVGRWRQEQQLWRVGTVGDGGRSVRDERDAMSSKCRKANAKAGRCRGEEGMWGGMY